MSTDQKPVETTKHQFPAGHQSPGTPPGTTTYETSEPKRRESQPEAEHKRAPQHEPGYEAKHQKEAQQESHKRPANERSQADDSMAKIDADRDLDAQHTQKANRTKSSASKQHVKRGRPAKNKTKVRKHK